jgi:hypothetical protein
MPPCFHATESLRVRMRHKLGSVAAIDYKGFEAGDTTVIWRYMSLDRYRDVLGGHLYFAAAKQFDDAFEGAITDAQAVKRRQSMARVYPHDEHARSRAFDDLSRAFGDLRRMTKVSCWHARSDENVAMWERYRPRTDIGVAIRSTVGALKNALGEFRLQPRYGAETILVGAVKYLDYATDEMSDKSMLGIFMHKRAAYRDEREVRALLSLRLAQEFGVEIPDDGVAVSVEPGTLIQQVRLCPRATEENRNEVARISAQAGVKCSVDRSALSRKPTY